MADKTDQTDKTLRIIFSGISMLTPGAPRHGDKKPLKAFVMMAANPKKGVNAWETTIPPHSPFVCVDPDALESPPKPQARTDRKDGDLIYFFSNARVKLVPGPKRGTPIKYHTVPEKPLAERPGSDDVAPADDIRWLADLRDILSKPAPLKKTADPAEPYVGDEVAAVVNLEGGTLRANFPCDSVHPKTFADAKGNVVPGLRRVLADEFMIDIPYPKETKQVTLSFQELRKGTKVTGPEKLVLKWPEKSTLLEVRMGNDPEEEVRRLNTPQRCDPVREREPVLKPRDDDFDLHYNFFQMNDVARPLPKNDIQQCDFEGCKPASGGG